ncbi:hypothetical protein NEHOM01_2527, partial [Nematocida homosporus]|uniref:uncharacterized protein n=1 Tax=Nematocida homosporus TaxID=1912981 RepID=UPI00221E4039
PVHLEEEIATIETKLIKLAKRYDSKALNKRGKEAKKEEEELEQLSKRGDFRALAELLLKSDKEVEKGVSKAELAMLDKAKAIINATNPEVDEVMTGSKPTKADIVYGAIQRKLTQISGYKEMKAPKAIGPKPIKSQPSILPAQLSVSQTNEPDINNDTLHLKDSTIDSIPILYKANPCLNLIPRAQTFDQKSTPIEELESFFDSDIIKLSELKQKNCTLKLNSKEEKLLQKFLSISNNRIATYKPLPVWKMFDINRANQPQKYGLSATALHAKDMFLQRLDWKESELMGVLDVLKKFSKIILNVEKVWLWYPCNSAGWLVLAQLLTLLENSELSARMKPLEILITLPNITCPSSVLSFNNVDLQTQFRKQIEKIEKSRYIITMDSHMLTSNVQEFIWPLVTHLSISRIDLIHPIITKIDFFDDVNWVDHFSLKIHLDYKEDTIVSLGARTAKGKVLPTCEYLNICTNYPYPNTPLESTSTSKIYVVNLDGYLQPKSSNEKDKFLTTNLLLTADVLVSYATF